LVEPPEEGSDVERDRVEKIDDLDAIAPLLEPLAELFGRAIMTRAHRRGNDQDAPTHGHSQYLVGPRHAGNSAHGPA